MTINHVQGWWLDRTGLRIRPVFGTSNSQKSNSVRVRTINTRNYGETVTRTAKRDDVFDTIEQAGDAMAELLRITHNVVQDQG
jgi:hypothetical protein